MGAGLLKGAGWARWVVQGWAPGAPLPDELDGVALRLADAEAVRALGCAARAGAVRGIVIAQAAAVDGAAAAAALREAEHALWGLEVLSVRPPGVGPSFLAGLCATALPELEALDVWLSDAPTTPEAMLDALEALLSGRCFPRLSHLGLRHADFGNTLAWRLSTAPVVEGLRSLDLSGGTVGDRGAEALLSSPAVAQLSALDLSDNFLTGEACARLEAALPGRCACQGQRPPPPRTRYLRREDLLDGD